MAGSTHDRLVKGLLSNPLHAAAHLRVALPADVLAEIDLETLSLVPGSFVDPALGELHSDLLFSVQARDGRAALIYLLFEHQSTPDGQMPWRLLRTIMRIWERWVAEHPGPLRLPPVLPLVLYHGEARWWAPLRVHDLVDWSDDLRVAMGDRVPDFHVLLRDLSLVPDEDLRDRALGGLLELLLKHARRDDFAERLPGWAATWQAALQAAGLRAIELALRYVVEVSSQASVVETRRILRAAIGQDAEVIMGSWAEALRAEGIAIGEQRGIEEGIEKGIERGIEKGIEKGIAQQRAMFRSLLTQRFGPLPAWAAARLDAADTEALTAWTERFFQSPTLEVLLDG